MTDATPRLRAQLEDAWRLRHAPPYTSLWESDYADLVGGGALRLAVRRAGPVALPERALSAQDFVVWILAWELGLLLGYALVRIIDRRS